MAKYNILSSNQKLNKLTLENFKGYDFSSSPLSVDKYHASGGKNMICDSGINHKRNGWGEVVRFASGGKVNGLWEFTDNAGDTHTIVHCGNRIYRVHDLKKQVDSFNQNIEDLTSKVGSEVNISKINSGTRSYAVAQNNRLYIFCGDYLIYVLRDTWVLERVENNIDTYIPVTTISIDSAESVSSDAVSFEEVNMLSKYRQNKMTVPYDIAEAKYNDGITYYFDSPVIDSAEVIIAVETVQNNKTTITEYRNKVSGGVWGTEIYKYPFESGGASVGSVRFGTIYDAGVKFLSRDTLQPTLHDGSDRITVTFSKTNAEYSNRVSRCTFGTMFGTHGNTDRIFISGNADYKNIDFFSAMDDYTYFGDNSSSVIGSNTVAIMGYSRLGDGTLAIHKGDSSQEATIYYRSGSLELVYADIKDDNGQVTGQKQVGSKAVFPLKSGSNGEGVISSHATANLSGDNLMLSKNGVYGIVLGQNVATNERFARERSRTINEKLTNEENLQEAVGVCYKNKYYLCVNDHCYIADSRFLQRSKEDMTDTFSYEWWYFDNIPARILAVLDNKLYFGTEDGRICVFQNGYADRSYMRLDIGEVTIDYTNSALVFSEKHRELLDRLTYKKRGQKDYITLKGKRQEGSGLVDDFLYMYRLRVENILRVENNRIYLKETATQKNGASLTASLLESETVYADNGLIANTPYRISEVDIGENSFGLTLNGEFVDLEDSEGAAFSLCRRLNGEELELHTENTSGEHGYFATIKGYSDKVEFCSYNGMQVIIEEACMILQDNVVCEWYTAVMDLGSPEFSKSLKQLTVVAESNISSEINVGYETRKADKLVSVKGTSLFDFADLDFSDFTFETSDFCKSYTKKLKEKNVNHIVFRIVSDNDRDAAVNKLIVSYMLGKKLKGVN